MGNRIRRNKNNSPYKIWLLVLVIIVVFCLLFFAARGRFGTPVTNQALLLVLSPFQRVSTWVGDELGGIFQSIDEIMSVREQNKQLRDEVKKLRVQNQQANEFAAENERLRKLLDYKLATNRFDLMAARVIGREVSSWTHMLVINRGTADGVADNMAVITNEGLVGRIVEAGVYSSKVELILDPRSSVGSLVQRPNSRIGGIVRGDMDNPLMPVMANIDRNADIKEGDVIITSGLGGVYPKGIVVGLVSTVKDDAGGLLKNAYLETAVDFERLEDVMVVLGVGEATDEDLLPPPQTPGTETKLPDMTNIQTVVLPAPGPAATTNGNYVPANNYTPVPVQEQNANNKSRAPEPAEEPEPAYEAPAAPAAQPEAAPAAPVTPPAKTAGGKR